MPRVQNTYSPDGTLNTSMDRTGVDIGQMPNFWGDLADMYRNMRPVPSGIGGSRVPPAALQAGALGQGGAGVPSTSRTTSDVRRGGSFDDFEGSFGTLTYPYGSAGMYVAPGLPTGAGQSTVAMGYQRRRR